MALCASSSGAAPADNWFYFFLREIPTGSREQAKWKEKRKSTLVSALPAISQVVAELDAFPRLPRVSPTERREDDQ